MHVWHLHRADGRWLRLPARDDVVAAVLAGEADPCAPGAVCTGSAEDVVEPLVNVGAPGCADAGECANADLCVAVDCSAGACEETGSVSCELGAGLDAQCNAAYCDPSTGECVQDQLDGVGCDDGDAATCDDACGLGVCAGSAAACGSGSCVDPPSCIQDSECRSGKCRSRGKWANTCAQ